MGYTLLATMRDEAPFILEWVAYHKAIGFDRLIIFSNNCSDGTDKILAALHATGHIIHIPHQPSESKKIAEEVSQLVLSERMIPQDDWTIWLDADEFLNIHCGTGHVADLRNSVGDARGICISWRVFGDSGNDKFPGLFISEDFINCADEGEAWQNVKTFFRMDYDVVELFQHKPMFSHNFWNKECQFLSSKSIAMDPNGRYMSLWMNGQKRGKIEVTEAGWKVAQINHYAVRTKRMFDFKRARGRIGEANSNAKSRYNETYYSGLNLNSEQDRSVLRWSKVVLKDISSLERDIACEVDIGKILSENYQDSIMIAERVKSDVTEFIDVKSRPDKQRYQNMHQSHHAEIETRSYSNNALADAIISSLQPKSVIDVGCGIGLLMNQLAKNDIDVLGIEGTWLQDESMIMSPEKYLRLDLENSFTIQRKFDVCCCIEVAEHLDPSRADGFIKDICALSGAVVFSAAIAGQGGKGHKNEQWQEYWCSKFESNGFSTFDLFRDRFRRDNKMLPWLQQNVLLFLDKQHRLADELIAFQIEPEMANMIHPTYHEKIMRRTRRSFRRRIANLRVGDV